MPSAPVRTLLLAAAAGTLAPVPASAAAAQRTVPPDAELWSYRVAQGDTLIGIADRFLARPADWPAIQSLNAIKNPRRLQPDSVVRLPFDWLRQTPATAEVLFARGDATLMPADAAAGTPPQPLAAGATLHARDVLHTGPEATVTLRLADGSRLLVTPGSDLTLARLLRVGRDGIPATRLGLDRGRTEIQVAPANAMRSLEVRTPAVNLGVRGTVFRAQAQPAVADGAASAPAQARVEVIEGRVGAEAGRDALVVPAGQGTRAEAGRPLVPPRPLVPAPDLHAIPPKLDRLPLAFTWPAIPGAQGYRAQVLDTDATTPHLLLDAVTDGTTIKFADLPDGRYVLSVRGMDALRLEGLDAHAAFQVKARPEPPATLRPAPGAKTYGAHAVFAWATVPVAKRYRVQVSATPDFAAPVIDEDRLTETTHEHALAPGAWWWRVATIVTGPDGEPDRGPWGDAQPFTQRPIPPLPGMEAPEASPDALKLRWRAPAPGDRIRVQADTSPSFASPALDVTTTEAATELPHPAPGKWWIRARTIDADGFEGVWSSPQQVEVPRPKGWWWLLLPFAIFAAG